MSHLSGKNFAIVVGDTAINVETMSATISDNRKAVMTRGVPDGHVDGDVSANCELEIGTKEFLKLVAVARAAGSWRQMPAFNIVCSGAYLDQKAKVELFGCLLNISDLLNVDPKGSEKTKHKLPFEVTSSDFVKIDGVPYLAAADTQGL